MGRYSGKTCRLLTMLVMTASFFLVEIIVGYITNSIALVADSFHMLSDIVALVVGVASVRISKWRSKKNTFGWARAEVLGALVNSVFLVALCFSIFVEALKRLVVVEHVENPQLLLIVGSLGLLINIVALALFHNHGHSHGTEEHGHSQSGKRSSNTVKNIEDSIQQVKEKESLVMKPVFLIVSDNGDTDNKCPDATHSHEECDSDNDSEEVAIKFNEKKISSSTQMNMRAVFLHVLGDALGSVIVIISALVIWFVNKDWVYYLDPAMSIVMVCVILTTTTPLLKKAAFILLQTVPAHIKVKGIKEKIKKIKGVISVHEFHVWQLTGNQVIASAHICCLNLYEYMDVANQIKDIFHNEGIHSTTIQPEFSEEWDASTSKDCVLTCGPERACYLDTCCGLTNKLSSKENASSNTTIMHTVTELPLNNHNSSKPDPDV